MNEIIAPLSVTAALIILCLVVHWWGKRRLKRIRQLCKEIEQDLRSQ